MDYFKRRPSGDYQPKGDPFDALPLRQHEELDSGAYSPTAQDKLFRGKPVPPHLQRRLSPEERLSLEGRLFAASSALKPGGGRWVNLCELERRLFAPAPKLENRVRSLQWRNANKSGL